MILKFRHKGLKWLYENDNPKGVRPEHVDRLRHRLTNLDAATEPEDLDLPGYRLHPLKGDRKGEWSIRVSGNWRVTFRFESHDVTDVDYEDYH
ncbi:MAG: type II toxin-antitoxin system RelE/ParE family toxin [Planctomycetota bacterium]